MTRVEQPYCRNVRIQPIWLFVGFKTILSQNAQSNIATIIELFKSSPNVASTHAEFVAEKRKYTHAQRLHSSQPTQSNNINMYRLFNLIKFIQTDH